MKIINPIYDKAFKYLMENEKFAKRILSIILDVPVLEVTLGHQETHFPNDRNQLSLFRLDFRAVVKEADGSLKTVLIELQKSKHKVDIERFRSYLGANYLAKNKDGETAAEPDIDYHGTYPIITIYILGYNLPDLPYMAVTVNREIINSVSKERLDVKSFFIEHLTHQSHVIQVKRLPEKRRSRLEKFFMLFNQDWRTDTDYILDIPQVPEGFIDMAKYLQMPLLDDQFRRNMLAEEEIREEEAILRKQIADGEKQLIDAEEKRKDAEKKRKDAEEKRKDAEEKRKDAEEKRKEAEEREHKEHRQKVLLAAKFALHLKQTGTSIEDIMKITGLSHDEIGGLNFSE